ncbi:hypothetical protein JHC09_01550 [Devosia sp. MC532]|uniref:hypothetical protein n=1 Tax=Devosia sp. MC532 TaxID=2799788 RepID=UPI0018F3173C|nr:hypothetical protein [Devosia sp. MC532]MBJ7576570.1 hypothetical protein [Devosia sp. MC532]
MTELSPQASIVVHGITTVSGRYSLGARPAHAGLNLFACRLRMIATTSLGVAAPIIPQLGDMVTARFAAFGALQGPVTRRLEDGFEMALLMSSARTLEHNERINNFTETLWTETTNRRSSERLLPKNPRTIICRGQDEWPQPCLVIDYSGRGAAVSAPFQPAIGELVTIGQLEGAVVRLFDIGFAVQFTEHYSTRDAQLALEAPKDWRHAMRRAFPSL